MPQVRPEAFRHQVTAALHPGSSPRLFQLSGAASLLFSVSWQFLSGVWRMNNLVSAI